MMLNYIASRIQSTTDLTSKPPVRIITAMRDGHTIHIVTHIVTHCANYQYTCHNMMHENTCALDVIT